MTKYKKYELLMLIVCVSIFTGGMLKVMSEAKGQATVTIEEV
jgi:hypothetical protein